MVRWLIRAHMADIEVGNSYAGHPTLFSIRLFHGGVFTKFPGRKYINGKEHYVDLCDIDVFSVHDIDDMMDELDYVREGKLMYYHFKQPLNDLDFGLFALGSDDDIRHLKTYVHKHKLIEVYVEHGKTRVETYKMSPIRPKVVIEEIKENPSCSRRLFIKWKNSNDQEGQNEGQEGQDEGEKGQEGQDEGEKGQEGQDEGEKGQECQDEGEKGEEGQDEGEKGQEGQKTNDQVEGDGQEPTCQFSNGEERMQEQQYEGQTPWMDYLDHLQPSPHTDFFHDSVEDFNDNQTEDQTRESESEDADFIVDEDQTGESESEDADFIVDEDNFLNDVEVDMRDFRDNVDKDVEWTGSSFTVDAEETIPEDLEVFDPDIFYSGSSSEDSTGRELRRSVRALHRMEERSLDPLVNPFHLRQSFKTAAEVKDKIRKHAIHTRREIELVKNDANRIRAECMGTIPQSLESQNCGPGQSKVNDAGHSKKKVKDAGPTKKKAKLVDPLKCPWVLLVSKWKDDAPWMVRTYNKQHRCLQTRKVKSFTSTFISKQIMEQIEGNPKIPVPSLQTELQRRFELGVSKMKAFRAKTKALNLVRGDYAGQYSFLRDYVLELQTHNPDTTVTIDVESEPDPSSETRVFKRIYICLGSLKKGFIASKRDFLGLDGAFMKGPYPGQVLSAVGLDGNNGTYPLAYAVVEAESFNSWSWFLNNLAGDLGLESNSNFTFISDRQKGVLPAIAKLFPCAEHRFCLRHIHENLKLNWKGSIYKDMLWKCAAATNIQQFRNAMEEIKDYNKELYEWLMLIQPQHWAKSHFSGRAHCDALLNNMCESFNSKIMDGRDKPIITALEFIREYLMKKIVNVQKVQEKCDGPLTPAATQTLDKIKSEASQYRAVWNGGRKYQVSGPWMDQCVVDMQEQTCTCRKWELTGIPCKHAVAAIWDMQQNGQDVGIPEIWVHSTYHLVTWKEMYSYKVEPINGRPMWAKSPCPTTLLPPKHHVPVGRPKKKRRKGACELQDKSNGVKLSRKNKSVTCSKCKNVGHNARSCKGQSEGGSQAGKTTGACQSRRGTEGEGLRRGRSSGHVGEATVAAKRKGKNKLV